MLFGHSLANAVAEKPGSLETNAKHSLKRRVLSEAFQRVKKAEGVFVRGVVRAAGSVAHCQRNTGAPPCKRARKVNPFRRFNLTWIV
jgi:hypothetical protein